MHIFLESIDQGIWDAIFNGPFVSKHIVDNNLGEKLWADWSESKKTKSSMAKNIITSALNIDDF